MQPTHAEIARTLSAGHLPASAHIACRQGPFPVRHVADGHGRLLWSTMVSHMPPTDTTQGALYTGICTR